MPIARPRIAWIRVASRIRLNERVINLIAAASSYVMIPGHVGSNRKSDMGDRLRPMLPHVWPR